MTIEQTKKHLAEEVEATWPGGGPAFPVFPETGGAHAAAFQGMALRDYFAGRAMPELLRGALDYPSATSLHEDAQSAAEIAYVYADAMLAEREK